MRIADHPLDVRTHVIEVEGQIDLYAAPALKERAMDVTDGGAEHVILDLSRVDFIDSAGLGALLDVLRSLHLRSGTLALVITDYDIERLLVITGLNEDLAIFRSVSSAVASLTEG